MKSGGGCWETPCSSSGGERHLETPGVERGRTEVLKGDLSEAFASGSRG